MPLRSNVVRRSSISSEECTSAGSESFTSSYRRYPRSLPTAMSWRTASYFSSRPTAATNSSRNQTAIPSPGAESQRQPFFEETQTRAGAGAVEPDVVGTTQDNDGEFPHEDHSNFV